MQVPYYSEVLLYMFQLRLCKVPWLLTPFQLKIPDGKIYNTICRGYLQCVGECACFPLLHLPVLLFVSGYSISRIT